MKGSIKLLIATLGVIQFSSVTGEQRNEKKKEQLRRSLRKGVALSDPEMETERKMQFVVVESEDAAGDRDPAYDDYFKPPESMLEQVDDPTENYFENTDSGMEYNWESAGSHGHGHSHDEGHTADDHMLPRAGKSDKTSKFVNTVTEGSKLEKSAKIGKWMWAETPVMVKSGKSDKKSKDSKSLKARGSFKGSKGSFVANPPSSTRVEDHSHTHTHEHDHDNDQDHDHFHDSAGGLGSGFTTTTSAGAGYSSLFSNGHEVHQSDDFFPGGASNTVTQVQMGQVRASQHAVQTRSGSIQGRHENTFDDDFFNQQERLVFRPRPMVTVASSVFSVNPETLISPVVPDGTGDTLTIGTEYLFNEVLTNSQNIYSQLTPVDVDGETVLFIVSLDGYCNRIGPPDQNSVQGYCFLTYTFIDPSTQMSSGSFTAQGIIVNASVPGQLTITGGTGTMTGATGLVEILPAAVNNDMNPPELVAPIPGVDPFNGIAGWAHFFEFDVDVLFFLPELYAR